MQLARRLGSVLPWGQENGRGREGELLDTRFAMTERFSEFVELQRPVAHAKKRFGQRFALHEGGHGTRRGRLRSGRVRYRGNGLLAAGWEEQGAAVRGKVQ
jgi:hypothetical protein